MFDQRRHRRRRRANLEDLWPVCGAKGNPADAVLFEKVDQAEVQPVARVALDQVETEPPELTAGDAALDRHLRDRCGMEAPRQFLFDDGAAADAHFVDDHLAGHHAEDELLATVERDERALARVNRGLADLAGWRIGVKLLDRAREQQQELVDRGRVGGPRDRAVLDAGSRSRTTAARSCRWSVRTVIACACVDSHGLIVLACRYSPMLNPWSDLVLVRVLTGAAVRGCRPPACTKMGKKWAAGSLGLTLV